MQGATSASIHYGLFDKSDALVAVMTFALPRKIINYSSETASEKDSYEIVRYSTALNTSVVGGASKLLNHFVNTHKPSKIYSYADLRWGDGNMYRAIGMSEHKASTGPNYWYIIDGNPKHRFAYAKHRLATVLGDDFDTTKSEYQNMVSAGYDRVWDCGSALFVLKLQ